MGLIRTTYEIITDASAQVGDAEERGYRDEEGTEYTVDEAIRLLKGCEPSSSEFHCGIWYTQYGEMDPISGDTENLSYHLSDAGWTEAEERTIFHAVRRW